jgi:hypothetical protein
VREHMVFDAERLGRRSVIKSAHGTDTTRGESSVSETR